MARSCRKLWARLNNFRFRLPEMDGFDLCKRFRKLPDLEHTNYNLSGQTGAQVHTKAYELGADNYLEKPFNAEELALVSSKFRKTMISLKKNFAICLWT